jgi:hypothetical protein
MLHAVLDLQPLLFYHHLNLNLCGTQRAHASGHNHKISSATARSVSLRIENFAHLRGNRHEVAKEAFGDQTYIMLSACGEYIRNRSGDNLASTAQRLAKCTRSYNS